MTNTGEGTFLVTGVAIERLTRMTNFDQIDSVDRYQRVLDRSGISDELERQGVEEGDTVTIAGKELSWGEEFEYSSTPSVAPRARAPLRPESPARRARRRACGIRRSRQRRL